MKKLDHPYECLPGGMWLRGNLHAHTTRSDGRHTGQAVIDDYAGRGYDFLALTDHDVFTSDQDYGDLDSRGMTMIPGNEISANGCHLLHLDGDRRIEPHRDRQKVIDDVAGTAGFVIVNHPNWQMDFNHCPLENLVAWQGYAGIEIFNGIVNGMSGSGYSLAKWEMLLAAGRRVWGYAHDDSHAEGQVELGWNVVYTADRSRGAIVAALRSGSFYASTGVTITSIQVEGMRIRIETENACRIRATQLSNALLALADDRVMEIQVPDEVPYVRFECWGAGERFAWTQPFWVAEGV